MKWRNEEGRRIDESKIRKDGDIKATRYFAWIPETVDGDDVWLHHYYRIEKWNDTFMSWGYVGNSLVWD